MRGFVPEDKSIDSDLDYKPFSNAIVVGNLAERCFIAVVMVLDICIESSKTYGGDVLKFHRFSFSGINRCSKNLLKHRGSGIIVRKRAVLEKSLLYTVPKTVL